MAKTIKELNGFLQAHVTRREAIGAAERAEAHILGRPRPDSPLLEKARGGKAWVELAQSFQVQTSIQLGLRNRNHRARLWAGDLQTAKFLRRGDGQRGRGRKSVVAVASKLHRPAIGFDQRLLHLMGESKIDLLLEDRGDDAFKHPHGLRNAQATELARQPCHHPVRLSKAVEWEQIEVSRKHPLDKRPKRPEGQPVFRPRQDADSEQPSSPLAFLAHAEEDRLPRDLRGAPEFALLEIVEQRGQLAALRAPRRACLPKPRRRRAQHEAERTREVERLSGLDHHASQVGAFAALSSRGSHCIFWLTPDIKKARGSGVPAQFMVESPQIRPAADEATLVAQAKAGSYPAFEELVSRYEKKIYRLGLNITGNVQDAEDVLQETFLKAFEHLPDFRADSRFYTWIVRIAVNEGLMKLRKRRSDKTVSFDEPVEGEEGEAVPRDFADWKPNPEQLLAQAELERILRDAGQALPPIFRTVFLLRDVEGLSTEEAAELLGITPGAVKARLFRARLRLREELSRVFRVQGPGEGTGDDRLPGRE